MKIKRVLFVMLALSAGIHVRAQLATNVPGVFPNTNIVQSFAIGFAQGSCNDGIQVYVDLTQMIQWYPITYKPITWGFGAAGGITNGLVDFFPSIHLGDPDYYRGYIYVPMEDAVGAPKGAAIIDVAIFKTGSMTRSAAVSISNYQSEASAVCIDPVLSNSTALFATSWASASTNDGIYEYSVNNLTNLTFVKVLPMTQRIPSMQGIICIGGMLYVIGNNGPAGEIYQVNPTNGVVIHLAQVNIAGETEWEGLDYQNGFLVADEGATGTVNWFDFFGVLAAGAPHSITGWVNDSNNHPIVGVRVIAAATINGTNQIVAMDTDTNGNYVLNVTNGNWSVAVNCNSGSDSLGMLGNYFCPNNQTVTFVNNIATNNFIVPVCNGVSIITPSLLPAGEAGVYYSQTLQAFSCSPGYTWIQTGSSLPPGLSLSSGGILAGTPSGPAGTFNFNVQVADGNNAMTNQAFSIAISNAVQVTTPVLPDGSFYNMTLSATNGQPPYTWSMTPGSAALPSGLSLASNGVLAGQAANSGTFSFSMRVTDSLGGFADQPYSVNLISTSFPRLAISGGGVIPLLSIGNFGNMTVIVLASSVTNYVMQSTTNLASPDWQTASDAVPLNVVVFTNTPPMRFFRLQ